jgi:hypothetical protein
MWPAVQYVAVQYAASKILHTYPPMKMEQTGSETSEYKTDAGKLPRRKHTTFRTWRKFEIKKIYLNYLHSFWLLKAVLVLNHHQHI